MTNKVEMVNNKIEELENNDVVAMVRMSDGYEICIEELDAVEELENAIALGTVALEDYENNGYEIDGLALTWLSI